jgi:hypothetical protein
MHKSSHAGEFSTAVLLDDDPCGLWPECGCDADCAKATPFAARPKLHFIEKLLLALLVAAAIVGGWCALT